MPTKKDIVIGRLLVVLGVVFVVLLGLAVVGGAKMSDLFLGFVVSLILINQGWRMKRGQKM